LANKSVCSQWLLIFNQVLDSAILNSPHRVRLCVFNGFQNKLLLFFYTAMSGWLL